MSAVDQLDARVENFRRESLKLQEKRDELLLSIDLIKSNEHFQELNESKSTFTYIYTKFLMSVLQ